MITRLKGQFFGLKNIVALTAVITIGACSLSTPVKAWDRFTTLQAGGVAFGLYAGYRLLSGIVDWVCSGDESQEESCASQNTNEVIVPTGDFKSLQEIAKYVSSFAQEEIFSDVNFNDLLNHLCIDFQNHITQVSKAQVWKRMMDLRPHFLVQKLASDERLYPQLDGLDLVPEFAPSAPSADLVMAHELQQQEREHIKQAVRQLELDLALLQQGRLPVGYAGGIEIAMLIDSVKFELANLAQRLGQ